MVISILNKHLIRTFLLPAWQISSLICLQNQVPQNYTIIKIKSKISPMHNFDVNIFSDCIEAVYANTPEEDTNIPREALKELIEQKTKTSDFEILKNIAKGGYGEVFLVRSNTKHIYAMKRVSKDLVLKQPHTALFMAEKELLVKCRNSEWLVSAAYTLQDNKYLYYIMDFIPGGDFMGLLSKEDVLEENWVKFYAAEIVAALDELHNLGWIHRDLKPDNILIGLDGHIKLADFGSSIKMENGKARSSITVGTPDYVSPDVLTSVMQENEYSENVDFWTLGVIIYEMLYGTTPFYSPTLVETYRKITNIEYMFPFKASDDLTDLIKKLICKKDDRLTIQEIKAHPFFNDVDWNNIKNQTPPFIPNVRDESDTSYFIDTQFDAEFTDTNKEKGNFLSFIGFTYDPKIEGVIKDICGSTSLDNVSKEENVFLLSKQKKIEDDIKSLESKLHTLVNDFNDKENEIEMKEKELDELKENVTALEKDYMDKQQEYKHIILSVLNEKEELEVITEELYKRKNELKFINNEIRDKNNIFDEYIKNLKLENESKTKPLKIDFCEKNEDNLKNISKNIQKHCEELRNSYSMCIKYLGSIQLSYNALIEKYSKSISKIREYSEDKERLIEKNKKLEIENSKIKNVGVDSLKKQLRMLNSEVKEYQQKLDQEIMVRKKLEDEIVFLRKEKSKEPRPTFRQEFNCKILSDEGTNQIVLKIVDDSFHFKNKKYHINNVFITGLKNNEMHHLSYKERSLVCVVVFLKEGLKSVSSAGRRNIKCLEEELLVEENIKSGLESMMPLLSGKGLSEAEKQYEDTLKKIAQLRSEIDISRKSTLTEDIPDDPVKVYEFNNHLFTIKTFPPRTLCEHCNEVLYGLKEQGFQCKDCKMVVHKSCYVLGDVSCEMYLAMKKGEKHYIMMRNIEERDRLISVYKNM